MRRCRDSWRRARGRACRRSTGRKRHGGGRQGGVTHTNSRRPRKSSDSDYTPTYARADSHHLIAGLRPTHSSESDSTDRVRSACSTVRSPLCTGAIGQPVGSGAAQAIYTCATLDGPTRPPPAREPEACESPNSDRLKIDWHAPNFGSRISCAGHLQFAPATLTT
jgi:hypothetical protein